MSDEQTEEQIQERPEAQSPATDTRVVNSDGTTNWTVVFEDPEQGILPAVRSVTSEKQLRAIMASVAQLLFKRKRDEEPRAEFLSLVNAIIDTAEDLGFEDAHESVIALLEKEKNLRIQKALLHIKNKRAQSIERRRDEATEGPFGFIVDNPLFLGGGIAAILAAITVVLLLVVLPGSIGGPDAPEEAQQETAEQVDEAEKPAETSEPVKRSTPPAPKPKTVEMVVFKPVAAEVLVNGKKGRMSLIPLIELHEDSDISLLCTLAPRITEGVLIMVQAATDTGKPMDTGLARSIGKRIADDINQRSKRVQIDRIMLRDLRDLPRDVVSAANRGCGRVDLVPDP
ncbi:MAG: hypothetical protein JJ900_16790 [Rhodospirillales bacterium]|nr:hypothetical protein [Rhodospirillales bacterium]MBO6788507.1 hypothetical protein [Rhodospirillales bacterium]